ncbi:radical activating enzyme [Olavius sp. associated proteobacterium Delta 1]|nr:radical activating enzyme [Olavius sp. associated proteobacterium Delta 1]
MKITRRAFIKGTIGLGGALVVPDGILQAAGDKDSHRSPAYEMLENKGLLVQRVEQAYAIFQECRLCPRQCGVNRLKGEKGFCRSTASPVIYSAHPHFGEEASLVGSGGSGTIFFSNCNLRCVFCQNWPISHEGRGKEIGDEDLADLMLYIQKISCHNVNLVTPTHLMPNILNATRIAHKKGLRIPLVYNTSGYESVEMLKLLDGVVDIYLPDMKFMGAQEAELYMAGAADYPEMGQNAILEMHRQVGLHKTDANGITVRGVMIRHLVMPNRVAGTEKFVRWLVANLPNSTYVNIMHQYHVDYKAYDYPKIQRSITAEEYLEAMEWAVQYGLTNLDPKSVAVRDFYIKHQKN